MLETLEDPILGSSFSPREAALQKAFGTQETYFEWLLQPDNQYRFKRYAACIRATSLWDPPETLLQGPSFQRLLFAEPSLIDISSGFDWSSLNDGDLIVDVGGGTGAPAMIIAEKFPKLRFVIQDQKPVVAQGTEVPAL